MTPEMKQFLTDYLAWAGHGGINLAPFNNFYALCGNIIYWIRANPHIEIANHTKTHDDLTRELSAMFRRDDRNAYFPFGEDAYEFDEDNRVHHLHPPRLKWISRQLAK